MRKKVGEMKKKKGEERSQRENSVCMVVSVRMDKLC